MQINHTDFTKREAMIIRESLWEPMETLAHYPKEAFLTNYLVQSNVTRAELAQTLEKLWDALPNKYEDELEESK